MGRNPEWRGSVATWRARIGRWMQRSSPDDLRTVDCFFDMRGVHGDSALCGAVWRAAYDTAAGQVGFAKHLLETADLPEPGLAPVVGFRTRSGRIDLKRAGLHAVVSAARALALCHHVVERTTPARLAGVKAQGLGGGPELDALAAAQATFLDLLIAQQAEDIDEGVAPTNAVLVKRLSRDDRERLREALIAIGALDRLSRELLLKG
jgi:DNA polymerase-3 subunit epsilon/CBS domain-containing protein